MFPHSRAFEEEDEMAEERRLCYVGMTRARSQLVLTGAARRRVFGEYQAMEPSRFLDEVPPQLVERIEPAYPTSSYQGSFGGSFGRSNSYTPLGQPSTAHGRPAIAVGSTREEPALLVRRRRSVVAAGPEARVRRYAIRSSASARSSVSKNWPMM